MFLCGDLDRRKERKKRRVSGKNTDHCSALFALESAEVAFTSHFSIAKRNNTAGPYYKSFRRGGGEGSSRGVLTRKIAREKDRRDRPMAAAPVINSRKDFATGGAPVKYTIEIRGK